MRKSSAIRAAMRLRKWCKGRRCDNCPLSGETICNLTYLPKTWPVMSFEDKEDDKNASD